MMYKDIEQVKSDANDTELDVFSKGLGIDDIDTESSEEVINDGEKKTGLINFAVGLMRESGFNIKDSDIDMVSRELTGPLNARTLKRTINKARKNMNSVKKKKNKAKKKKKR